MRPNLTIRWAAMKTVLYRGDLAIGDMNANERELMAKLWTWATHDDPTDRPWIRREHMEKPE